MEAEQHPLGRNIETVMKLLKQNCFDFVVAGGYARDVHYGKNVKDCDICIFNFHEDDEAEKFLLTCLLSALEGYTPVRLCEAYDDDDSRLGNVIKLDDWKIDIIFYANAATARDVVSQFDCNMNQFYFANSIPDFGNPILPEPSLTGLTHISGEEPTEFNYLASGDLNDERIIKMGLKWCEYTKDVLTGEVLATFTAAKERASAAAKSDIPW